MTRKLIAIVLILLGIVGVAGGVWGLSLRSASEVDPDILAMSMKVLGKADGVMATIDGALSDWTRGSVTATGLLNDLVGSEVDLTSEYSVKNFVFWHAVEILLSGVIGIETGLLLFTLFRRRG